MILTVIGTGNMGQALVQGFLKNEIIRPNELNLCDIDAQRVENIGRELGAGVYTDAAEAVVEADYVLIAVKPQVFDTVLKSFASNLKKDSVLISIAAAVSLKRIRTLVSAKQAVVRVMPNTPALVGAGVSAVCFDKVSADAEDFVTQLLSSCGLVVKGSETQLDAIGCVSGTGPAYLMLFIEAMADAAVKLGIPRTTALEIAAATLYGSGKLATETGLHPAVLKDQVCSPGGTTIEGVIALEKAGLRAAVISAIEASADKNSKMAGS